MITYWMTDGEEFVIMSTAVADEVEPDQHAASGVQEKERAFVLRYVQPGLAGLMDGSVSTLAPIFAVAFATHNTHTGSVRFQTSQEQQAAVGWGRPVARVVRQLGAARTPLPIVAGRGGVARRGRRLR